jgi:hypothetical protein
MALLTTMFYAVVFLIAYGAYKLIKFAASWTAMDSYDAAIDNYNSQTNRKNRYHLYYKTYENYKQRERY